MRNHYEVHKEILLWIFDFCTIISHTDLMDLRIERILFSYSLFFPLELDTMWEAYKRKLEAFLTVN